MLWGSDLSICRTFATRKSVNRILVASQSIYSLSKEIRQAIGLIKPKVYDGTAADVSHAALFAERDLRHDIDEACVLLG
jgi:hypothetical protein